MVNGENKRKHLEFLQDVISRMTQNSFFIKGWTVTIVSAVLILMLDKGRDIVTLVRPFLAIPIILFWMLDSYYLRLERGYINRFDAVRKIDEQEVDYNLKPLFKGAAISYVKAVFSITLLIFYGVMLVGVFILLYYAANS